MLINVDFSPYLFFCTSQLTMFYNKLPYTTLGFTAT